MYLIKIFIKKVWKAIIVDILMLIISRFFPYRVGTYRQVLHLFIKTITVCRKLMTKYMATNNMRTFYTITIG